MENFQGDTAVMLKISCKVNRCHSPAAELALERVTAGDGGLQTSQ